VKDHVHSGEAACGSVLLLPIERDGRTVRRGLFRIAFAAASILCCNVDEGGTARAAGCADIEDQDGGGYALQTVKSPNAQSETMVAKNRTLHMPVIPHPNICRQFASDFWIQINAILFPAVLPRPTHEEFDPVRHFYPARRRTRPWASRNAPR
jgi:hypothetical protein